MKLNSKYLFGVLIIILALFIFSRKTKRSPRKKSIESSAVVSENTNNNPSIDQTRNSPLERLPPPSLLSVPTSENLKKSDGVINQARPQQPTFPSTLSSSKPLAAPKVRLTDRIIKHYETADLSKILQHSPQLAEISSTVLANQGGFLIPTSNGPVYILSSMQTGPLGSQTGCVSIREKQIVRGSFADSSMVAFKLPEPDAFAIVVRTNILLVFYGNTATWGQQRPDEEQRVLLYYRKARNGAWVFLGQGRDDLPVDSSPAQSHDEYCSLPLH
jgi:hypothetical protein